MPVSHDTVNYVIRRDIVVTLALIDCSMFTESSAHYISSKQHVGCYKAIARTGKSFLKGTPSNYPNCDPKVVAVFQPQTHDCSHSC